LVISLQLLDGSHSQNKAARKSSPRQAQHQLVSGNAKREPLVDSPIHERQRRVCTGDAAAPYLHGSAHPHSAWILHCWTFRAQHTVPMLLHERRRRVGVGDAAAPNLHSKGLCRKTAGALYIWGDMADALHVHRTLSRQACVVTAGSGCRCNWQGSVSKGQQQNQVTHLTLHVIRHDEEDVCCCREARPVKISAVDAMRRPGKVHRDLHSTKQYSCEGDAAIESSTVECARDCWKLRTKVTQA